MSVIGPRPDLPEFAEKYTGDEPRKLEVRPGITGYSQAYYRNSANWREKVRHDIIYIDNISIILDIRIFFRTAISVLTRKNIYITQNRINV